MGPLLSHWSSCKSDRWFLNYDGKKGKSRPLIQLHCISPLLFLFLHAPQLVPHTHILVNSIITAHTWTLRFFYTWRLLIGMSLITLSHVENRNSKAFTPPPLWTPLSPFYFKNSNLSFKLTLSLFLFLSFSFLSSSFQNIVLFLNTTRLIPVRAFRALSWIMKFGWGNKLICGSFSA